MPQTANFTDARRHRHHRGVRRARLVGYHAAVHLWPARNRGPEQLQKHWSQGCYERIKGDMFDSDWHLRRRGRPKWVAIYYERREVGRFPTLDELRHRLFILADLAPNGKEPRTSDDPADMHYIRVWELPSWAKSDEQSRTPRRLILVEQFQG